MSRVEDRLKGEIAHSGAIPFARFMEEALYGDGGYYAEPERRIGPQGDFVTGSSLSPLFAACTARLLERLDGALGRPAELLEVGYGDGRHLATVAELSASAGVGRRLRGVDRMARSGDPRGFESVATLAEIDPGGVDGLVFSYELFDALPVHRLIGTASGIEELQVALSSDGEFVWRQTALSDERLATLPGRALADGQIADLSPAWRPLYRQLAERLGRGLLVTFDYGFERDRLLDPRVRRHGTLACYRSHHVHRDPFREVGAQDLTAHVDFTTLREEGEAAGLSTVALTRQARWLTACGLFEGLEEADRETRLAAAQLLDGEGMGEEIRVLVQARGVDAAAILETGLL